MSHRFTREGLVAALLAIACTPSHAALSRYSLFDLGALTGPNPSSAEFINDSGQVIGRSGLNDTFIYTPGTGVTDFATAAGLPAGTQTAASDLNNLGHIVGSFGPSAFIYRPGTALEHLPVGTSVLRINDAGQYIGQTQGQDYRYTPGVGYEPVPGIGTGMNNQGDVAFTTPDATGAHAGIYRDGGAVEAIGSLGGNSTWTNDINNRGDVVGHGVDATGRSHAFRYMANVGIVDLDTFGFTDPEASSNAIAINDHGVVVGQFTDGVDWWSGFISDGTSGLVDIHTLLDPAVAAQWRIDAISDINNSGQLIGHGMFNGRERAFILNPIAAAVPEPATAWLVLLGLPMVWRLRGKSSVRIGARH